MNKRIITVYKLGYNPSMGMEVYRNEETISILESSIQKHAINFTQENIKIGDKIEITSDENHSITKLERLSK